MIGLVLLLSSLVLLILTIYAGKRRIASAVNRAEDVDASTQADVDSQILNLLRDRGVVYQSEIVRVLNLPKSTVHKALRRLSEEGYIEIKRRGRYNLVVYKFFGKNTSNRGDRPNADLPK